MYVKDYGEKYYDLIKNRMDNTIYLFDANPLENMKFLEENGEDVFPNIKKIRTYLKENKVDLIITDIRMAIENTYGVSGRAVIQKKLINLNQKNLLVILITWLN